MKFRRTAMIVLALSQLSAAAAQAGGGVRIFPGSEDLVPFKGFSTGKSAVSGHFGELPVPATANEPAPQNPQTPPEPFPNPTDPTNPYPQPNPTSDPNTGTQFPSGARAPLRITKELPDGHTPVFDGIVTSRNAYLRQGNYEAIADLYAKLPPDAQAKMAMRLQANFQAFSETYVSEQQNAKLWQDPVYQQMKLHEARSKFSPFAVLRHGRLRTVDPSQAGRTIPEKIEILRREAFNHYLQNEAKIVADFRPQMLSHVSGQGAHPGLKVAGFSAISVGLGAGGMYAYTNWSKVSDFLGNKKVKKDEGAKTGKNESVPKPTEPSTASDSGMVVKCSDIPGGQGCPNTPAPPAPPSLDGLDAGKSNNRAPDAVSETKPGELRTGPTDPFAANADAAQ